MQNLLQQTLVGKKLPYYRRTLSSKTHRNIHFLTLLLAQKFLNSTLVLPTCASFLSNRKGPVLLKIVGF